MKTFFLKVFKKNKLPNKMKKKQNKYKLQNQQRVLLSRVLGQRESNPVSANEISCSEKNKNKKKYITTISRSSFASKASCLNSGSGSQVNKHKEITINHRR